MMNREKYNSLDLFKFIFAFAVVSIHTHPLEHVDNIAIISINELFVRLAVPFFFICSGFLIGRKLVKLKNKEEKINIIQTSLKKFLKMYLIWTIIYAPLAFCNFFQNGYSITKACLIWFRNIIFVGENYNSFPLWYLLSSIYALLILYMLYRKKVTKKKIILLIVVASILSIIVSSFASAYIQFRWVNMMIKHTINNGRIFNGMVYIPIGILMAEIYNNHKKYTKVSMTSVLVFFVSMVARYFFAGNQVLSYYLLIIASVSLMNIILSITLKDKDIYKRMRGHSMIIFLIHMYVWTIYYKLTYGTKTFGLDSFIVVSVISLLLSMAWCVIQRKATDLRK